jgi:hypothetical protein
MKVNISKHFYQERAKKALRISACKKINFHEARKSQRDLCAKFELLIDEANKFSYRFPETGV